LYLILSVPDEGHSRNTSYAQNSMVFFSNNVTNFAVMKIDNEHNKS